MARALYVAAEISAEGLPPMQKREALEGRTRMRRIKCKWPAFVY
jgi:hypothetical protein